MFAATLRGMLAHKLRLVLTTASIALGVAFLAGTLILTDTMKLAFDQLFGKVSAGTDAVVRQEAAYEQADGVGLSRGADRRIGPRPGPRRRRRPRRRGRRHRLRAADRHRGQGRAHQRRRPDHGLQPARSDVALRGDVKLAPATRRAGRTRSPSTPPRPRSTTSPLGSDIKILFRGPTQEFTVVGTVGFGGEKDLGGTTIGVLRHRDRAEGARLPRHVRRDRRARRRRRHRRGAGEAARRGRAGRRRGGDRRARRQGDLRRHQRGA